VTYIEPQEAGEEVEENFHSHLQEAGGIVGSTFHVFSHMKLEMWWGSRFGWIFCYSSGQFFLVRPLWVASWPLAGCDLWLESFGFGSVNIGLVLFYSILVEEEEHYMYSTK
jgi:hypothetical protein